MVSDNSIVINKLDNTLLATVPPLLSENTLVQLQDELLDRISQTDVSFILCDFSGVELLDAQEYSRLTNTLKMASLMGAETILVGLSPGIAAMIVDHDIDIDTFQYALDIEQGLLLAQRKSK